MGQVESEFLELPVKVDLAIDDGLDDFWKETAE
jgi:hypothetical protein